VATCPAERGGQDIQAQLKANLNIDAEIVVMESGAFIDAAQAGQLEGFHLLGWGADYPDQTNFLDYHFGQGRPGSLVMASRPVGCPGRGRLAVDQAARNVLYGQANELLKQHVPMVPVAHGGSATVFKADVEGAHSSPLGNENLSVMDPAAGTRWSGCRTPSRSGCTAPTNRMASRCGPASRYRSRCWPTK